MKLIPFYNLVTRTTTYQKASKSLYNTVLGFIRHNLLYTMEVTDLIRRTPVKIIKNEFKSINLSFSTSEAFSREGDSDLLFNRLDFPDDETIIASKTFNKTIILLTLKKICSNEDKPIRAYFSVLNTKEDVKNLRIFCLQLVENNKKYKKNIVIKFNNFLSGSNYSLDIKKKKYERNFKNVFISANIKRKINDMILSFKDDNEFFSKHSIPRHTGLLLYGEPGTGKSSLVQAICTEFRIQPLYLSELDLFSLGTIQTLKERVSDLSFLNITTAIIIEDVDIYNVFRNRSYSEKDDSKMDLNMSTWLNLMDGADCLDNVIWIFTTNKLDVIDKALYRPGRIDYLINVSYIESEAFDEYLMFMFNNHLPENRVVKEKINLAQVNVDVRNKYTFDQIIEKYTEKHSKTS